MTFVSVGNVLVDILTRIPALPERGGDVQGAASGMSAGGAFNAMVAASRQGLPAAYAGGHGTGYFGDLVRSALLANDIDVLLPATPDVDSGYDLALVDDAGERTFVTAFGAEASLTSEQLASIRLDPGDVLHVSGYSLLEQTNGAVIASWIGTIDPEVTVLLDPGPLVADIPRAYWDAVLWRSDWVSCNEREYELIPDEVLTDAAERFHSFSRGWVKRLGADGCEVQTGDVVQVFPPFPSEAIDTNGAGDAHVGAFAAGLAAGLDPYEAAERANAAAALAVGRFGPATAPTLAETLAFMGRSA